MAKVLSIDQLREVGAAANSFQRLWDASRLHPQNRNKLLKHFNRLPSSWEENFIKFLRPETVAELRKMA